MFGFLEVAIVIISNGVVVAILWRECRRIGFILARCNFDIAESFASIDELLNVVGDDAQKRSAFAILEFFVDFVFCIRCNGSREQNTRRRFGKCHLMSIDPFDEHL